MALPSASDFNKYDGTKFNNTDWDQNVDKTVEILAAGNYDLNVNQITAQTYANIPSEKFSTLTAGEDLDAGDVVRISGGQLLKADNTTQAGITDVVGINVQTVTSGNTAEIAYGFYDDFSSLTVGTTYYVGVGGGITSTLPTTYKQQVGIAVSSTRINFSFNSDYSSPSFVVDELILPYDPDRQFTSSSYTRLFDYESGPSYGTNCRWDRNKIGSYNVFLTFAMTGGLGTPYEIAIRFMKSDSTVVFDTGDFAVGNQGSNEMSWFSKNIASGNSINLDLTTTILNGINWPTSGGYVAWEPQIRINSASGGAYIKYLSLVLVRSEA